MNSTWLITSEQANQRARKALFICVVYTNFKCFSREIDQFQSTWVRFGKDKTMQSHVNMSTSCRHVIISPCLWLQLVTEVPVGIWIRDKFKPEIDRSVKTLKLRALNPDQLGCWARHFTLTVPLSTQVCKWIPANSMLRSKWRRFSPDRAAQFRTLAETLYSHKASLNLGVKMLHVPVRFFVSFWLAPRMVYFPLRAVFSYLLLIYIICKDCELIRSMNVIDQVTMRWAGHSTQRRGE